MDNLQSMGEQSVGEFDRDAVVDLCEGSMDIDDHNFGKEVGWPEIPIYSEKRFGC